jgi:hypothetical protein
MVRTKLIVFLPHLNVNRFINRIIWAVQVALLKIKTQQTILLTQPLALAVVAIK